ncbi:MAG TPA: FAD:protein FMN transferase [Gammaproteobacteria bacterium]|nr:FAD:protein FMN transferase [Gammaproteobacteria bacterium]
MMKDRQGLTCGVSAFFTLVVLLAMPACSRPPALQELNSFAEGTTYHLTWWSVPTVRPAALSAEVDAELAKIDKAISNYRDDSDIARFNHRQSTDWYRLPPAVIHLLGIERTVYQASGGCYDPTIAPLFDLWGFRTHTPHVPPARDIAAVLGEIGFDHVVIDVVKNRVRKTLPALTIDMSSVGEGYSIWRLAQILEHHGIHNYIVEFGGDMLVKGHKPRQQKWRIAIEKPVPGSLTPQKIVTIEDELGVSINTSGTYRRFFDANGKVYSHILDPRTGRPVTHDLVSATVFDTDPRVGDAWATAILCLGDARGMIAARTHHLKVLFMQDEKGTLRVTENPALKHSRAVHIEQGDGSN